MHSQRPDDNHERDHPLKKFLLLAVAAALAFALHGHLRWAGPAPAPTDTTVAGPPARDASTREVTGSGTVTRILPDDTTGDRHQRFIVRTDSGQTILIAHNIDIAPRVAPLREGDTVEYRGEFVWNQKGGIVHWTHRDPAGRHASGWLKHDGQLFQ